MLDILYEYIKIDLCKFIKLKLHVAQYNPIVFGNVKQNVVGEDLMCTMLMVSLLPPMEVSPPRDSVRSEE